MLYADPSASEYGKKLQVIDGLRVRSFVAVSCASSAL
jgi:hypothetical protein